METLKYAFKYNADNDYDYYLLLQKTGNVWDWTLYDQEFTLIDGGQLNTGANSVFEAEFCITESWSPDGRVLPLVLAVRSKYDPEDLMEAAYERMLMNRKCSQRMK